MNSQKCSEICLDCGGDGFYNDGRCECNIGENFQTGEPINFTLKYHQIHKSFFF